MRKVRRSRQGGGGGSAQGCLLTSCVYPGSVCPGKGVSPGSVSALKI